MTDEPKVIWARVNGSYVSQPSGDRRMIGGWDEYPRGAARPYIRLDAPELLAMADALRKADQALHDDGCRPTMWPRPQINAAITAWEKLTK